MGTYETAIRPTKQQLFSQLLTPGSAAGGAGPSELRVLEVGIGTGARGRAPWRGAPRPLQQHAPHALPEACSCGTPPNPASQAHRPAPYQHRPPTHPPHPPNPGPNLEFMAQALGPERLPSLRLTGLDPNPAMQPYARDAAAAAGLAPGQIDLTTGDAQAMPYDDGTFDAAVITLVGHSQQPGPARAAPAPRVCGLRPVLAVQCTLRTLQRQLAPARCQRSSPPYCPPSPAHLCPPARRIPGAVFGARPRGGAARGAARGRARRAPRPDRARRGAAGGPPAHRSGAAAARPPAAGAGGRVGAAAAARGAAAAGKGSTACAVALATASSCRR